MASHRHLCGINKEKTTLSGGFTFWCGRGDLNPLEVSAKPLFKPFCQFSCSVCVPLRLETASAICASYSATFSGNKCW